MERGFLSQKGSRVGRGVKEKDLNKNKKNTSSGIGVSRMVLQLGVTPSIVDMTVEMEKQYSLEDTTVLESFLPLSMSVIATASNAPSKSLYANVTVWVKLHGVPVTTVSEDGLSAIATKLVSENSLDTPYEARSGIDHYAYSCDELALIHRIFFAVYGV
nr:hypothetical protein [Tanacetum cinerariifolium]